MPLNPFAPLPTAPRQALPTAAPLLSTAGPATGQLIAVFTTLIALLCATAPAAWGQAYHWANLAGQQGGSGNVDGTGVFARFNQPYGVAVDANENVYVADTTNYAVRKITPAGVVTTFAGSLGGYGSADGTGSAAQFAEVKGLVFDATGNIYVSDGGNFTIRKITSAGVVTTLAGKAGMGEVVEGTGSAARFLNPNQLAMDAAGNIYVADTFEIRKISSAGVVTKLAGDTNHGGSNDGTGSAARFYYPYGIAVDATGTVYVADSYNHTIRKVTSAGVVTTLAGSAGLVGSDNGSGSAARFNYPWALALDANGNLYVADRNNNMIRKITSAGLVTTVAGSPGTYGSADGMGGNARFQYPSGLVLSASGNLYVADSGNSIVRKITSAGLVTTLAGNAIDQGIANGTGTAALFANPSGVGVDNSGNVYVSDTDNCSVRKITSTGVVTTLAGTPGIQGTADGGGLGAGFFLPVGVAVDGNGAVYIGDSNNYTVRKIVNSAVFTIAGKALYQGIDDGTGSAARFSEPCGVAVDKNGNVYVADNIFDTIRKITSAGVVTTLAGTAGTEGTVDGTGSNAQFTSPNGVAVDGNGNVYVADTYNSTIRKITSAGVVTTFAGSVRNNGSADGTGSAARFNQPAGLAVDGSGNVLVADTFNNTIRKITSTGVVTTIGGTVGITGGADGIGGAAQFSGPAAIAVGSDGTLYVADARNNRIVRGSTDSVTQTPTLVTPRSNSVVKNAVSVIFTLSETAATGTLTLTFTGNVTRVLTLASSQGTADTHLFGFNPANPTAAAQIASGTAIPDGVYTVTLSYQDVFGNPAASATSTNVRVDTTAPTFNLPTPLTAEATGPTGAAVTYTASASDTGGSGLAASSFVPASGSLFPLGTTIVNASATDLGGNTASSSFTITVVDTTGPMVTVPASPVIREATGPGGAAVTFAVSANDLVNGVVTATPDHTSGSTFPLGDTLVHVTAKDARNNPGSANFTVRVVDTTGPVVTVPASPVVAEATGPGGAAVNFTVSANDLVDGAVTSTPDHASGSNFPLGDTPVHVTAMDSRGNPASADFTVRVVDTTGPVVAVPASPVVAEATGPGGAAVIFAVSANDLVNGAVAATPDHASGSTFPLGETPVHVTALDAHGNPGSADFVVRVVDTTGPVLNLPASPVTAVTATDATVVTFNVSATDAVDGAIAATATPPSGSAFLLGDTTVHVTAQDSRGNQAGGSFVVHVTAAPGLAGNYVALLTGPNGYAALDVKVSRVRLLSGYLRRPDGRRVTLPGTFLPAANTVTLNVSDGSVLTLNFDGFGHLAVSGSFAGNGDLATTSPPPGLPGHYSAMVQAQDGSLGWLALTVSSRGSVRVVGKLPDGTSVLSGAGSNLERDKQVAILGISSASGHPQVAGEILFSDLAASDAAGAMNWRNGAGVSQGATFSGAKAGPGSAGSLPLAIDRAGLNLTSNATLSTSSAFGPPLLALRYATSPGIFHTSFRAGTITHASGIWQQKAGFGVGNFIKGGQAGRIVIGALPGGPQAPP